MVKTFIAQTLCVAALAALGACGGAADPKMGSTTDGSVADASATDAASNDTDSGTIDPNDPIALCASNRPTFSAPSGTNYIQWVQDGTPHESNPPDTYAAFTNGYLSVAAGQLGAGINFGFITPFDTIPAKTYRCSGDDPTPFVHAGQKRAERTGFGTDCELTLSAEVVNGGRVTGDGWAYMIVPIGAPSPSCIHFRFDVKDTIP